MPNDHEAPPASQKEQQDSLEEKILPSTDSQAAQFKEGGVKGWTTALGGCLVLICTVGYANAYGVYQDNYTRLHGVSASRASWIGSVQLYFMIAGGLGSGRLLDMGYFRHTVLIGSLLYTFSLFMVSLAHPEKYYQIFLSQGLGMGLGSGLIYVPTMAVQSHHWTTRRPAIMGFVFLGNSIGGVIFPIMLNKLFNGSAGFAWGVRASAFIVLGLLLLANVLMHPRNAITSSEKPKPNLASYFTDWPYIFTIAGAFFVLFGLFFPYFYLQLFSVLHGLDNTFAFYTIAILNAAALPGRIVPNLFVPRFGIFNVLAFCSVACFALMFAMFGTTSVASVTVFAILYGFFSGAFFTLITVAVATLAREPSEAGSRLGLAYFLASIGLLVGNPIDGALLGSTFPWSRAIIFSGVMSVAGTICVLVARHFVVKRKGTQFV
ncbi:unnamed protein product [Peniophora sp. CBMAI 1063]|nr:unnamed protein product [Peniophora sp. CBMAI 1063]